VTKSEKAALLHRACSILRDLDDPLLHEIALATTFLTTANSVELGRAVVGLDNILAAAQDTVDAHSEGRLGVTS
jgi:hypothetical protein